MKIRKAETLKSLDELNLSVNTRAYLDRKGATLDELVLFARQAVVNFEAKPSLEKKASKWERELIGALDAAGFIRHDLYPRTYHIWWLYYEIASDKVEQPLISNELYETVPAITDEELDSIMESVYTLTETERAILVAYLCTRGYTADLDETAKNLGFSKKRICEIRGKAIKKLAHPSRKCKLPPLFGLSNPNPAKYSYQAGKRVIDPNSHMGNLDLSIRTYNCLVRAGFNTIADIINCSTKDWLKVKNLGGKSVDEIVEKVRAAGYPDFSINVQF